MALNFPGFYFFFGIFGFVVGAMVTWFFMANHPFESLETPGGPVDEAETSLLASLLAEEGIDLDEATIVRVLQLHGTYVDGHMGHEMQARQDALDEATRTSATQ
jgi:hypothetical protein